MPDHRNYEYKPPRKGEVTHRVTIRYLNTKPPGLVVFDLHEVKSLPEILRELAKMVEESL